MERGKNLTCALFKRIGKICVRAPHLHKGMGVGRGS